MLIWTQKQLRTVEVYNIHNAESWKTPYKVNCKNNTFMKEWQRQSVFLYFSSVLKHGVKIYENN